MKQRVGFVEKTNKISKTVAKKIRKTLVNKK
jgi:hypothetical protein